MYLTINNNIIFKKIVASQIRKQKIVNHYQDYEVKAIEFNIISWLCTYNNYYPKVVIVCFVYLRKSIIHLTKRQTITKLLYHLLKSLKDYERIGFCAQVGMGNSSKKVIMYPLITLFIANTMQADKLTYASSSYRKSKTCRCCNKKTVLPRRFDRIRKLCIEIHTSFQNLW
jgi:hypothetical protein